MRLFLSVCLAALACAGSVRAADVPKKAAETPSAPAAVPDTVSWSGCYIGGHVGGAWGGEHWSNPRGFTLPNGATLFTTTDEIPLDQRIGGGLAGGQAGCRYQVLPQLVIGAVGDFSHANIQREDSVSPFVTPPGNSAPTAVRIHTDDLATAGGMIGFAHERLLVYGKGGAAWARNRYELAVTPVAFAGADFVAAEWRPGWFAGGGIEYAITPNLSTFLEFNYYDFGKKTVAFTDQGGAVSTMDLGQRLNAIRFGLNYKLLDFAGGKAQPMLPSGPILSSGNWVQNFQTETRYYSWKSSRPVPTGALAGTQGAPQPNVQPGSGTEIYIPYAWQLVGQPGDFKIELLGRGGWVHARQKTLGVEGDVATTLDTQASATVTYMGFTGIQPFAALELNLPTGRAAVPGNFNARMDPDLVDVASFGEGFNYGPSAGFNVPINDNLIVSASAGYTRRGAFTRETTLTPPQGGSFFIVPANLDPGNVFTATTSVGFKIENFTGKVTGSFSTESATKQNDAPFVKPGHRYLASATGSYAWPQEHIGVTTANFSFAHANRNDVLFVYLGAPVALITEAQNTNSNLYQATLDHLFVWDQYAIGPLGSFLYRDNNGYDAATLQFVPAKTRWSAGAVAKYAPNSTVTFNARVERIWTHEDENPAPGDTKFSVLGNGGGLAFTVPVVSSTGWQFVLGASARF